MLAISSAGHAGKAKRRRLRVVVAGATYSLKAGQKVTLHVKLNARGRALRHRFHRLPVSVVVTQHTATGTITVSSAKLTIKPASKHRKHARR